MATLSTVYVSNLPETTSIDGVERFLTIDGSKLKLVEGNLLSAIPTLAKTEDIIRLSSDINTLSSKIENFTNDDLNNIHTIVQGHSASWDEVYTHVQNESANWVGGGSGGSDVSGISGNWEDTYNIVQGHSGNWDTAYDSINNYELTWNTTTATVNNGNYNWDEVYETVHILGGKDRWNNVYTQVKSKSSNWEDTYNIVNDNKDIWNNNSPVINYEVNTLVRSTSSSWSYNIEYFGVIGDGSLDVTSFVQNAIDTIPNNSILHFPNGIYNFDSYVHIHKPVTIDIHPDAILRTTNRPETKDERNIFYIKCGDVTIQGGTLSGDRNIDYIGTGRSCLNNPYDVSDQASLIFLGDYKYDNTPYNIGPHLNNITIQNVTFIKSPFAAIGGVFDSGRTQPDTSVRVDVPIHNLTIRNNKFILNKTHLAFFNNKNIYLTETYPTNFNNYKYLDHWNISNNTFLSSGKIQPTYHGYNRYNPQGMGLISSKMYIKPGVFISSIPSTNRVSISGLNFDNSSIGYVYKIQNFKAENASLQLTELTSALGTYFVGITSVNLDNSVAEAIILDNPLNNPGQQNFLKTWNPVTISFTNTFTISGLPNYSNSPVIRFSQRDDLINGKSGYDTGSSHTGNVFGILGAVRNLTFENNYIDDCGRHTLEFLTNNIRSHNITVRNNIFKNCQHYIHSYGGEGIIVENNIHENSNPILELYGNNVSVRNNSFYSGIITWGGHNNHWYDNMHYTNNFIQSRPNDWVSISDLRPFKTYNHTFENNEIVFPNGIDAQFPSDSGIFDFKFIDNLKVQNNTITIKGSVSSLFYKGIPSLFILGGTKIDFSNNTFYLSGYGSNKDSSVQFSPHNLGTFYTLLNSNIKNNSVITKFPIRILDDHPIWNFSGNQVPPHGNLEVAVYENNQVIYYKLYGYPGLSNASAISGSDKASAYPYLPYVVDRCYLINSITDFTVDSTHKYYLSGWNDNRNKVARYLGDGNWKYYTIKDVVLDDRYYGQDNWVYGIQKYTTDIFLNKETPIANYSNNPDIAFIVLTNYINNTFSNVTFENNNFTFFDTISCNNYNILQKGLWLQYSLLNNFKIINQKDTVTIKSPVLTLNSNFETNGYNDIILNNKGDRFKLLISNTNEVSAIPITYL